MTRKRFKKLCMGFGYSRNAAEDICVKCGYDVNTPYIFLYCSLFKQPMPVKSKKQAKYFGEPYLSTIELTLIERCIETSKKLDLPIKDKEFRKQFRENLENKFLELGLWTYNLIADTVISILSGKTDIETVRKSVRLMPWESAKEMKSLAHSFSAGLCSGLDEGKKLAQEYKIVFKIAGETER